MAATWHRGLRERIGLCRVIVAACLLGAVGCSSSAPDRQRSAGTSETDGTPAIGGAFRLVDLDRNPVTDQTLKGKPYAIFFGFTRCPDVCPTTMNRIALLHKRLGADAEKLHILFVSVDPEHDKPADIKSFLSMFDIPVIGLTGTDAQLKAIEAAFRVYVGRVPLPNGDYTIDHTATIYLMDRNGRFFEPMSASETIDVNLDQLRKLLTI